MFTKESIDAELRRVSSTIPKIYRQQVTSEAALTPTMADVVEKALADPGFPEEKKVHLRVLKESGHFDKKKVVTNEKIAKKIDEWTRKEIRKSIKAGRLPNKKQLAVMQKNDKK